MTTGSQLIANRPKAARPPLNMVAAPNLYATRHPLHKQNYAKQTQFIPFFAQKQRFCSKTNPKRTQNEPNLPNAKNEPNLIFNKALWKLSKKPQKKRTQFAKCQT